MRRGRVLMGFLRFEEVAGSVEVRVRDAGRASPGDGEAHGRAAELEVLHGGARVELVSEVAPHGEELAPARPVADAGRGLPGQVRFSRADVEVVRQVPGGGLAESVAALEAGDAVPVLARVVDLAAAGRPDERAEV